MLNSGIRAQERRPGRHVPCPWFQNQNSKQDRGDSRERYRQQLGVWDEGAGTEWAKLRSGLSLGAWEELCFAATMREAFAEAIIFEISERGWRVTITITNILIDCFRGGLCANWFYIISLNLLNKHVRRGRCYYCCHSVPKVKGLTSQDCRTSKRESRTWIQVCLSPEQSS